MLRAYVYATILSLFSLTAAYAQGVDYEVLTHEGFGDVAEFLQSMTPSQRDAILKQAGAKSDDLSKLTPEQLQSLEDRLHKE